MGRLKTPGFVVLIVLTGAIIGLIVSCDQSDNIYYPSSSYSSEPSDDGIWNTISQLSESGLAVVVEVERGEDPSQLGVEPGQHCQVDITVDTRGEPMDAFEVIVVYDSAALTLEEAYPGELYDLCDWEFFTSHAVVGESSGAGYRIRGIANLVGDDNSGNPTCYGSDEPITVATLNFLVTTEAHYEGKFSPIIFTWGSCASNCLSLHTNGSYHRACEKRLWVSDGHRYSLCSTEANGFPTVYGITDDCISYEGIVPSKRRVDFFTGGVLIKGANSPVAVGDVNLNGTPCEDEDIALFANCILHGTSVLDIDSVAQTDASDVNVDGIPLTLQDLVYMVNINQERARPTPLISPKQCVYGFRGDTLWLSREVSGLYLETETASIPALLAQGMQLEYAFDGDIAQVLLFSASGDSASGDLLVVSGGLSYIEAATPEGGEMRLYTDTYSVELSTSPCPFTDSVLFSFDWPFNEDYHLQIFDSFGHQVGAYKGASVGEIREVIWQPKNLSGGLYYAWLYQGERKVGSVTLIRGE
ncbi:MAG TPA: hypothetical protein PLF13_12230 [candidate division Zixibacteria bacterium]|nr:hypothetical protein [candidate division Zixibacteria bacterium]